MRANLIKPFSCILLGSALGWTISSLTIPLVNSYLTQQTLKQCIAKQWSSHHNADYVAFCDSITQYMNNNSHS